MTSMKEKITALGMDEAEFQKDLWALNDRITDVCTTRMDFGGTTMREKVYPYLREMKDKYGFDIPIGMTGVDLPRLEAKLDFLQDTGWNWKKNQAKATMDDFQMMRLKAYSNISLKRPLSPEEYTEMMAIAKELGFPVGPKTEPWSVANKTVDVSAHKRDGRPVRQHRRRK
jgi:hypothetical protein